MAWNSGNTIQGVRALSRIREQARNMIWFFEFMEKENRKKRLKKQEDP
jgi:hypothetical protein